MVKPLDDLVRLVLCKLAPPRDPPVKVVRRGAAQSNGAVARQARPLAVVVPIKRRPQIRRILVRPVEADIAKMRGWKRDGNTLRGAYRTRYGSFCGEIILGRGYPEFYIFDPPRAVLVGPHAPCFRRRRSKRKGKRYFVHMAEAARQVDSGILAIEKLITRTRERRATK